MRNKSIMPFPDVREHDTGIDYSDISDLQYKKGQNRKGYEALRFLDRYLSSIRLFAGHCVFDDGYDCFITEDPQLDTKTSFNGKKVLLINADDKRYADRVRMWQFPSEYSIVTISRTIHMRGRKVEDVDVHIDRSNQSAASIEDAFLRKALIRNKNKSRIESIIQTIQRKQDEIRLLPAEQSFIVQGCAGSGKTMVLLHRLRYLLYNREIASDEYLFLVPTNKFRLFIGDVCNAFRISMNNVVPIQTYYMTLVGGENSDESQDISELVFEPTYLKRVYSKEFIQDAIKELLQQFRQQSDALVNSCDAVLSEIMETTSKSLNDEIKAKQDRAVASALIITERVQPYIRKKLKKYSDITVFLQKLQSDYAKTVRKGKSIVESEVNDPDRAKTYVYRDISLDEVQKIIEKLRNHLDKSQKAINRAQKKLNALQRDVQEKYQHKIELLNDFIETVPYITEDCGDAIENVDSPMHILLQYIDQGRQLQTAFSPLSTPEEQ